MNPTGESLFLSIWPAATVAAGIDPPASGAAAVAFTVSMGGLQVPLLTSGFAVLGVVLSRPLSPKGQRPLGAAKNLCVTIILALLALAWVIDSRPGLLFGFIISIGLGFSGFAIIELAGHEAIAFMRRLLGNISRGDRDV